MQFTKKKSLTIISLTDKFQLKVPMRCHFCFATLGQKLSFLFFFFFNKTSVGEAMGSRPYLIVYGEYKLA